MIIGISGKINSGKDTVGEIVQIISASPHFTDEAVLSFIGRQHLNSIWEIKKFADKLKDIVCMLLNVDRTTLEDREFKEKELGEEWEIPLEEKWKAVVGYEGLYEISSFGRVKSLNRLDSIGRVVEETIKAQHIGTTGYLSLTLSREGKKKTKAVHQLVAESFLGHTPDNYNGVVNHIDNTKTNNRLDNLEVVSSRYNTQYSKPTEGVYERRNKFEVYIRIDGKKTYLGSYTSKEEALEVRDKKLQEIDTFIPLRYVPKQCTPRLLLQVTGTQIGRQIIHPNIWCNSLMSEYREDLEEWKPIEGYEDSYYISNFGNVKSLDRTITYGEEKGNYHTKKGQILKPTLSGGYLTVSLSGRTYSVHTLVAMHFVENEKDNYVVNHIDYNKSNNFYKNLEWVTQGDNIRHNKTTLRGNFGESQKDAKLDVDKVVAIKKLLEEGTLSQNRIAKLFEVSPTTITDIKKGRKWNHVGKEIPIISPITPKLLPNWIITDMRFPNELKAIEDKGGITIRVERVKPREVFLINTHQTINTFTKEHESETALDNAKFDYIIENDGTLLELIAKVRQILIEQKILKNE